MNMTIMITRKKRAKQNDNFINYTPFELQQCIVFVQHKYVLY